MTEEKINHRPVGSGYTTIRIQKRTDPTYGRDKQPIPGTQNAGYFIHIGRSLWQQIGSPERVAIDVTHKNTYVICACGDSEGWRVVNTEQNGMPRISIGKIAIEDLGLIEETYQGEVQDNQIWFPVSQKEEPF